MSRWVTYHGIHTLVVASVASVHVLTTAGGAHRVWTEAQFMPGAWPALCFVPTRGTLRRLPDLSARPALVIYGGTLGLIARDLAWRRADAA